MRTPLPVPVGVFALLLLLPLTRSASATQVTAVDHNVLPVGETMTFTGTGLSDPSKVTFFWAIFADEATTFASPSDDALTVTFPGLSRDTRDHGVLIETATGSTVAVGPLSEFTGNGPVPEHGFGDSILIRAGAVATSISKYEHSLVYVESGAVLQGVPGDYDGRIFAENGATLDFRGANFSGSRQPSVYYSSGTTILGTLPTSGAGFGGGNVVRQITPLSLSSGVGPFTTAVRVNVTIVGDGTVEIDTGSFFVPKFTWINLTATPGVGAAFTAWSGDASSAESTLEIRAESDDLNLTATFSAGFQLQTFTGNRGSIAADPDLAFYPDGQNVSLTATPAAGFEFVRWGGALSGVSDATTPLVVDANKIVTAVFRPLSPDPPTQVTAVDYKVLPAGETMTFTGTGLSDPSKVTFFWAIFADEATTFASPSDDALTVTFPALSRDTRDHGVLIETPTGSTVATGALSEFTGNGPVPEHGFGDSLVIRAGAVATSISEYEHNIVYVESGALLQGVPNEYDGMIFAEDGATLDFRGANFSDSRQPSVYYSSGTTILGTLPTPGAGFGGGNIVRQVTPLSLSSGVGPFTTAVRVNVTIVGDGTVDIDTGSFFVPKFTWINLTATPGVGAVFTAWSGDASSTESTLEIRAESDDLNLTATFSAGYQIESFAGNRGSITADPDLEFYPGGQSVSLTATPAAGFEFVRWGGDLSGVSDAAIPLVVDANKIVTAVFRPLSPDPSTQVTAVDHNILPAGETMTFTGTSLSDPGKVTFFWAIFADEATTFTSPADDTLTVVFPELSRDTRDHGVLIETPTGSTVATGELSEFTGNGPVPEHELGRSLVIRAGAVATSISEHDHEFVYVESGALLQGVPNEFDGMIFAEDGATLDFRGANFSDSRQPSVYYSSGTTILGDLPAPGAGFGGRNIVRQVTPLSLSSGVGPFSTGCRLTTTVEGPGSVQADPDQTFYKKDTTVELAAIPDEGAFFIRWVGPVTSTSETTSLRIRSACAITARFSDRPDFFIAWRARFFTPEELADPDISGLSADPDGDSFTNAAEYAFGTDPTVAEPGRSLSIAMAPPSDEGPTILITYFRPVNAADITYGLRARTTPGEWLDGTTEELRFTFAEQDVEALPDDIEKVTVAVSFPDEIPPAAIFQLNADIEEIN